jgi:hypothetical protein
MRLICIGLLLSTLGLGDTLTLRSGRKVDGTYLGGDSRAVRMAVGDRIETYNVSDISTLAFGSAPTAPAAAPAPAATAPPPATTWTKEIPAGTALVVRMIDDVDSERHTVGQTFRASLDEPAMVDGNPVLPRGTDVVVKLVEDKQSGRLTGRTELTLDIESVLYGGRTIEVATAEVTQQSESRTGQTARRAGGLAAVGAVIGAIAGGGKGAAVGATVGAGTGAGIQVATKGARVRIPSETRLSFTLQQPLRF